MFAHSIAALILAILFLPTARGQGEADPDAHDWIERMRKASSSLSHIGTYVYDDGAAMQSVRIVRRIDPRGFKERLFSLSGVAREVIRDGDQVVCIMSDTRSVLIAEHLSDVHDGSLPIPGSRFERSTIDDLGAYEISQHRTLERVAGREGVVIDIVPKDRYRYASRLVIDRHTGLLLKSDLRSSDGTSLERLFYTHLDIPESIPDIALRPEIPDTGFTRHELKPRRETVPSDPPPDFARWSAKWVPEGFEMISRSFDIAHPGRKPVDHRLFSDGHASFSLFIGDIQKDSAAPPPRDILGAVNSFTRIEGSVQIIVLGEVPMHTVEKVALSVAPIH
ncbi:MucB/RseB C-terminal domain-containing protein [Thioalkalivibrio sp. HK1]|uniref:MucB/RseB C-terminal domain-containing protein n=1 Tax=Thioalkalivibrio sp. HK1 TaxID=1469245 RepID=UPI0018CC215B|nr:MucB/RseB C-terminal domain-containing protein [Thioalkalivibrio sp. HK1]